MPPKKSDNALDEQAIKKKKINAQRVRMYREKIKKIKHKRKIGTQRNRRYVLRKKNNITDEEYERNKNKNTEKMKCYRKRKHDDMVGKNEALITEKKMKKICKQRNYRRNHREHVNVIQRHQRQSKKLGTKNTNDETIEHYLGEMNILCKYCNAKHFKGEQTINKKMSFIHCCSHGSVTPVLFQNFPIEIKELFTGKSEYSNIFRQNIRCYNNSVSFASFNANLRDFKNNRRGPYCFITQGQIYYQMNTALYPEHDELPRFGQLFIIDSEGANKCRMNMITGLNKTVMKIIDKILRKINIFSKSFHMMKEEIENEEKKCEDSGLTMPEIQMSFNVKKGFEKHRYNPQRCNEVAAIFSSTVDGEIPESYVTIKNKNTKELQFISSMNPNVEPWIYPLFFPFGTGGYDSTSQQINKSKRISRSALIRNLIAIRGGFNPILRGGRLFQQWIVDNYVKIEKDRMTYLRNNQKKLRSETYEGVVDYLNKKKNNENIGIGKIVILPSTFIGSPRNMAQNYQDAMAIMNKYGNPDLFVTLTCNPQWPEITENLFEGQQPCDRLDLITRVFDLKQQYLLHLIKDKSFFGKVAAYIYVIEFQKRGLPHVHMLITLDRNYKLTRSEIVDKYISAEIPDADKDPKLHNLVMRNMIHGPCGDWCMINGKCSKKFPKSFSDETTINSEGYPSYRRRNTGKNNSKAVDNRYVVPYCPEILKILNCHCNVEVVTSIRSIKYFYKCLHKSNDAADITITDSNQQTIDHDEIKQHIDSRYVGPAEAAWRILNKKLQGRSHAIIRLPIHLPNQQNLTINPGGEECDLTTVLEQKNMLIDYFALNLRDEQARQYFYNDIPTYYTFQKNGKNWVKRKSYFNVIGRMYSVNPSQIELFHLRLLLYNVKGATSFDDLKKVNNRICTTFTEACIERGLIEDDYEWNRAMNGAEIWMMPYALRFLFARILIFCQPIHPRKLWDDFKASMSEDYYQRSADQEQAENQALNDINKILNDEGKNISDYENMPKIINININNAVDNAEEMLEKGMEYYKKLNLQQKNIVDEIIIAAENNSKSRQTCFYIDGPGGSGKTFIYKTLYNLLSGKKKKVKTMAFTGIAAALLPNGKTMHRILGLPVPVYQDSSSNIELNTKESTDLKETEVFILDEAPMSPKYCLDIGNHLMQDIENNKLIFGGKILILGGDFRQLLPVFLGGTRYQIVNLSIKYSTIWKYFKILKLTENMRTLPHEIEFAKFLIDVGNGTINDENDEIVVPENCLAEKDEDIAKYTFEDLFKTKQFQKAARSAILAPRNVDVDEIDKQVVNLLDAESEKIYTSIDSVENCENTDEINRTITSEYLNTLSPSSLPPHELRLRRFAVIMLIRTLNINEGLCNGTRLLILELDNNLIKCQILTGDKSGEIVFINRIIFYCNNEYPFTFRRRQFPIKLAFAMTINKSQEQTSERIAIDLRKEVFNHGQLYVALSRVRSWDAVRIYLGHQVENNKIENYVYKELFDD